MFSLFNKKPKQTQTTPQQPSKHGLFGYHNLMHWYLNEFDEEERGRLKLAYGEAGMGLSFESFHSGLESPLMSGGKERGAVDLLSTILQRIIFEANYPIDVAEKVISKLDLLIDDETDVLEKHFAYLSEIKFYKRQMKKSARYEQGFVHACSNMIAIAEQARKAFEEKHNGVPNHSGFFDLLEYYEEKGLFDNAKWVADESRRVWGRSMEVNYEAWLDYLIEKGNKEKAVQVLKFAKEVYDEEDLAEFIVRIEEMN